MGAASKEMNATPPICYDDCGRSIVFVFCRLLTYLAPLDDAYRIAQSYGKTSDLCWEGRSFKVLYQQCLACIADNTNRSKGTVRDYIQPELEDFINYCEKREVTALTTVYSTRVTTVTGSQGPVTSTVVMGEVIRMGGETSSFAGCESCSVITMTDANDKTFKITMGPQSVTDSLASMSNPRSAGPSSWLTLVMNIRILHAYSHS